MWKTKWIIKVLLQKGLYDKVKQNIVRPLYFYFLLFSKLIYDKDKCIKLKLRTGHILFVYRFMDLFKLYEIFFQRIYALEVGEKDIKVIVDIGANKGYFTIQKYAEYPNAIYHCYEPEVENFKKLKIQLYSEGVNYKIYQEGVSGKEGIGKLFLDKKNDGAHSLYGNIINDDYLSVQLIDIKKVIERTDNDKIDLLKLDCEGAENDILMNLTPDLANKIKYILFEPTFDLYPIEDLLDHLKLLGYYIFQERGIFKAIK